MWSESENTYMQRIHKLLASRLHRQTKNDMKAEARAARGKKRIAKSRAHQRHYCGRFALTIERRD